MTSEQASASYPCPRCGAPATLAAACPRCGRAPDPDAAEVIRIDGEITTLAPRLDEALRGYQQLSADMAELYRLREVHASRVRTAMAAQRRLVTAPVLVGPGATAGQPVDDSGRPAASGVPSAVAPGPEATTHTVQNVLFVLGGLLLGVAAIVFTAVAWSAYGVVARAAILTVVTVAALSVAPLVGRRGLRATAETFAALGLVLMLLDGYAAWYVNLAGIADTWSGSAYAGMVCAITTAFGYGYARLVDVFGPRLIALLVAQPVLPLLIADTSAQEPGWSLTFAAVASANLAVLWRTRRPATGRDITLHLIGWLAYAANLLLSVMLALGATLTAQRLGEAWQGSGLLVLDAAVFAAGALVSSHLAHKALAGAGLAVAAAVGLARPWLLLQGWDELLVFAVVAAGIGAAAAGAAHRWRNWWTKGGRYGAVVVAAVPVLMAAVTIAYQGLSAIDAALPWGHAQAMSPGTGYRWQLPLAVLILTAAGWLLAGESGRGVVRELALASGLAGLAVALPGHPPRTLWLLLASELTAAAVALAWALLAPSPQRRSIWALTSAALAGHAALAGAGRPATAAVALGAVVMLGAAAAALARNRDGAQVLGGLGALASLLALPLAVHATAAASSLGSVQAWRSVLVATLAVAALVLAAPSVYRGYLTAAGCLVALYPLWPDLPPGESQALYAGVSALAVSLVLTRSPRPGLRWLLAVPALATAVWSGRTIELVLLAPLEWFDRIWTGRPDGAGLSPGFTGPQLPEQTWELAGLALVVIAGVVQAGAVAGRRRAVTVGVMGAALLSLAGLVLIQAPWPIVSAATLLLGLAALLFGTMSQASTTARVAAGVGGWLAVVGVAGTLPMKWSTITGLALTSVALATIAIGARSRPLRLLGWLAGAVSKVLLVVAIGAAGDLAAEQTAYLVLLVAAVLLAAAYTPVTGELGRAVEAAAHATALVALSFTAGHPRPAAGVLALWGVAIGLTALKGRHAVLRAAAAATAEATAWVLLLKAATVGTLEAYTLPVALLALAVGVFASVRTAAQPGRAPLSSWLSIGPALAAALLPSLAAVLTTPEQLLRRLLLGVGALAVVTAGAVLRRQAPVVLGGAVLVVVALHTLIRAVATELIDGWIPLAIGGALLVAIAITYERRRREAIWLKDTIAKMR